MELPEVAAFLDHKLLHLLLGLFVGFALSITSPIVFFLGSKSWDARSSRRAYDQLEGINTILDEELENLISGKDDHVRDTKYFKEFLLKVRDRCDHVLAMLEAKQERYTALLDEFERKMKMEKEEGEERMKMEKQKHIQEMQKSEEEIRVLEQKYEAMRWK